MCITNCLLFFFFFFKQKTAYEISTRDWSSDVCSSDLRQEPGREEDRQEVEYEETDRLEKRRQDILRKIGEVREGRWLVIAVSSGRDDLLGIGEQVTGTEDKNQTTQQQSE